MNLGLILEKIVHGKELDAAEAKDVMTLLVTGEATQAQAGGLMIGLRAKGVTGRELAAFAEVLRENAVRVDHGFDNVVDIVGTGGGSPSFNISSGSAFVAAAAGARVAKHGNRAVTSSCGSADVLEALGVNLYNSPERLARLLETCGIMFMLAPSHHPALRHIAGARRELGVRTVFNQLGPLVNPAFVQCQLLGVYSEDLCRPTAEALQILGAKRALVVFSEDGMDEISPCAPTLCHKVWDGEISSVRLSPADFGMEPLSSSALAPERTVDGNAAILREALSRPDSERSRALIPSAATALWLTGLADSLRTGAEMAREAIASGAALAKLHQLASESQAQ